MLLAHSDEVNANFVLIPSEGEAYLSRQTVHASCDGQEALEFSPDDPELLTTLGLLHLEQGDNQQAFECFGNALTHDPRHAKAILAAG